MLGAILGSLLVNKPMQYFGRKKVMIGHYLFFIFGFLLTGFTYFGKNKSMMYIGRFFMGFGAGCTTPVSQIYVRILRGTTIKSFNKYYTIVYYR